MVINLCGMTVTLPDVVLDQVEWREHEVLLSSGDLEENEISPWAFFVFG